jgi:cytoskeletal protein CcmA (bactofilin family)
LKGRLKIKNKRADEEGGAGIGAIAGVLPLIHPPKEVNRMFAKGEPKPPSPADEISAFLGKETVFEGKMTFQGVFRLDGKFDGEIFESGTLIVGETAVIKGKVGVQSIVILGLVEGEVHAKSRAEIHSTGKVYGSLFTPILTVNEGGIFDGHCKMESLLKDEDDSRVRALKAESPLAV